MSLNNSSLSSKLVAISLTVAVLAVAITGAVAFLAMSTPRVSQADVSTSSTTTQSTIAVSGVGTVNVQPDEILIDLGVANQGPNATQVLMHNSATMTAVINSIEGAGINSTDIQTTQFNFGPIYTYNQVNGSQTISGYQASNTVQVTLTGSSTSKLDTVINDGVNAGANQIQSIGYTISDSLQNQLKTQAMHNAVADANITAHNLAASENVKIIGIQSIILLSSSYPPYFYNNYQVFAAATISAAGPNYSVPFNPGQAQFTVNIQVTYLLG